MWHRQLHDAFNQGKRVIGHAFNHAVKFAGQLDQAVGLGKRVFSALQPAIQDLGASGVNRAVMSGIQGYEAGRNEIMGTHNKVQAHLSRLRRAAPELDI
jgi:hypothetical protein